MAEVAVGTNGLCLLHAAAAAAMSLWTGTAVQKVGVGVVLGHGASRALLAVPSGPKGMPDWSVDAADAAGSAFAAGAGAAGTLRWVLLRHLPVPAWHWLWRVLLPWLAVLPRLLQSASTWQRIGACQQRPHCVVPSDV